MFKPLEVKRKRPIAIDMQKQINVLIFAMRSK